MRLSEELVRSLWLWYASALTEADKEDCSALQSLFPLQKLLRPPKARPLGTVCLPQN